MSSPLRAVRLLTLSFALVAPTSAHAAWPRSAIQSGVPAMPGQIASNVHGMLADGSGGAFVMFADGRAGNLDIYLQRITSQGAVYAGWPAAGFPVCTATGDQEGLGIISDGAGGVIVTWFDKRTPANNGDIYALRVTGNATIAPGWTANGTAISTLANREGVEIPVITSDGAGGAFIAWDYLFDVGDVDVYGAHVTAAGAVAWSKGLVTPGLPQRSIQLAPDGQGGFFAAWLDSSAGNFDLIAARFNSAGNVVVSPTPIAALAGNQAEQQIVNDGGTGAFMCWGDSRAPGSDIYATHVNASLAPTAGWVSNGNAVCLAFGAQFQPQMVRDAADGILMAWQDYRNGNGDVFVQRMTLSGFPAPGWPTDGVAATQAPNIQYRQRVASDGAGGVIVSWFDERTGVVNQTDAYAQRITSAGQLAPHWPADGAPVCIAPSVQYPSSIVPDSGGGAIVAFTDARTPGAVVGMTQRIDHFGALGNAEPDISSAVDVPHDQGGAVKITWDASYLDADPGYEIGSYWIWRATTLAAAQQTITRGGRWLDVGLPASAMPGPGTFMVAAGTAWEYVASQPASGFVSYSYVAPTVADSGATLPFTKFMVQARASGSGAFWGSAPDSGLSVDNLSPSVPAPFNGTYASGSSSLNWGASPESDVVGYRLYRGLTPGFVPGPSGFVSQTPGLGLVDSPGSLYWYKVAAVDLHGNLSPFAAVLPSGTADVETRDRPTVLALHPPAPNPARGGAVCVFDLPHEASVMLALHDLQGRRVRTLVRGTLAAGRYRQSWDGLGDSGARLGPGIYTMTLEAGGQTLRKNLTLLR